MSVCFENIGSPGEAAINVDCPDVVIVSTRSFVTEPTRVREAGVLRSSVKVEITHTG